MPRVCALLGKETRTVLSQTSQLSHVTSPLLALWIRIKDIINKKNKRIKDILSVVSGAPQWSGVLSSHFLTHFCPLLIPFPNYTAENENDFSVSLSLFSISQMVVVLP